MYYVIGLMSGTSLDGLDIAYCKFEKQDCWTYEIIHFNTVNYDSLFRERLRSSTSLPPDLLDELSLDFGEFMAREVFQFLQEKEIHKLDLIASHGHTVFHEPEKGITLQIGSPKSLFGLTKTPVVYDFRSQDIAMGGQGAPLVPLVDKILFSNYDACLNLGGFSNISFDVDSCRIAFDISPLNIVLNHLSRAFGLDYDDKGGLASRGEVNQVLLEQLNALDYYKKAFPKSLAWEWVERNVFPLLNESGLSVEIQMRTFVEHAVIQICSIVESYHLRSVLLSGGGVYNDFLVARLNDFTPHIWVKADATITQAKEAMAFAFLGLLRYQGQVNVLSSVTGCSENHSSGKIYADQQGV